MNQKNQEVSLSQLSQLPDETLYQVNQTNLNQTNIKVNSTSNIKVKSNVNQTTPNQTKVKTNSTSNIKVNSTSNIKTSSNVKMKVDSKMKKYELVDFPETGQTYGEYTGKSPKQAAKKAFSRLARMSKLNNSNQKFIVFVIREKGGKQKEFKYMGQRVRLANDGIMIKRGNKNVSIKYKNIVNKYKEV